MDFIPKALGFMNPESLHRQQVERLHGGDIWPLVLGEVFLDDLYVVLVDCTPSPKTNTPLAPEVRASISSCLGSFWSLLPRCSLTGSGTQTLLAMDAIWSENLPNAPQTVPQGGTLCCVCASARTHTPVCVCTCMPGSPCGDQRTTCRVDLSYLLRSMSGLEASPLPTEPSHLPMILFFPFYYF